MDLEEGLLGGAACGPVAPIVAGPGEARGTDYLCIYYTMTYLLRKLIRKACAVTMMVVSLNIEGAFKMYRITDAEKSMNISALIAILYNICKA